MKTVAKVNRVGGKLLGVSIFLGEDDIKKFLQSETNQVEVEKSLIDDGIFLKIRPLC